MPTWSPGPTPSDGEPVRHLVGAGVELGVGQRSSPTISASRPAHGRRRARRGRRCCTPSPESRTRSTFDLTSRPVDFDDTPEEAAFRAEARAWLAAQRRRQGPARRLLGRQLLGRHRARGVREALPVVAGPALRRRLGRHHLAEAVRRPGRQADPGGDLRRGAGASGACRPACSPSRIGMVAPDAHDPRHARAAAALPRPDAARRRAVVPAVQRARGRVATSPA